MSEAVRRIHWPSFWEGFRLGWALPAYACIAFAGVLRRGLKGDFPAVEHAARQIWWTDDEQTSRSREAFDRLIEDWHAALKKEEPSALTEGERT